MAAKLAAAAVSLAGAGLGSAARAPTDKPNVVMLFVDDLGYGDLGFNGHPTTVTPNIDSLAWSGKILSSWYSGCPVCSGSRAALMTGRQFNRLGVPGVFGPDVANGLPLNETTVANQAKKAGYATAAMGKWHLGQRSMYLPAARGFDYYLGIPYSDDMGAGRLTPCQGEADRPGASYGGPEQPRPVVKPDDWSHLYQEMGYYDPVAQGSSLGSDPGASHLPLVYQDAGNKTTTVLEQPLDFTHLAEKYSAYVTGFIEAHSSGPFFLYMPFSHVHTTSSTPQEQYAGCQFRNTTRRGPFGDALREADWIIGNVMATLVKEGIAENTVTLFTGDNGPWLVKHQSGGSEGLLTGVTAGYENTGKGSTWEGGMHEAAFAHWPGQIEPMSRSAEVVSSLDLFPTVSALLGVELPAGVVYDGKDMSAVLLDKTGKVKSSHDYLFFYGGCSNKGMPSAVRAGAYKVYWCTGPGLGGGGPKINYNTSAPLVFNLWEDPSEAYPLSLSETTELLPRVNAALAHEMATFYHENVPAPPGQPSELWNGTYMYAICCDRSKGCNCNPSRLHAAGDLPWFAESTAFE